MSLPYRNAGLWPVLLLSVWPAWGETPWDLPPLPPRSSLSLDLVSDSEEGWSRQLSASLAIPLELQLNLVYGESIISSPAAEMDPGYRSVGIASDPLNPLSLDLTYDYWGKDENLTIDSVRLGLGYNAVDFSLGLITQQRSIKLYTYTVLQPYLSHVDIDGKDVGITLGYYGLPDWALNAEYFHYDYSKDLTPLAEDFRVLFVFPVTTLELAGGLYARHALLSVTRFYGTGEIGFELFRAASAVDGSHARSASFHTAFELTPAWALRLQGGLQREDSTDDSIVFMGLGVDYLW